MSSLVVLLPAIADPSSPATAWWRIVDGAVVEAGRDGRWLDLAHAEALSLIALAPAASVRLHFAPRAPGAASDRQALTVARMAALGASLGDPETLHTAGLLRADGGQTITAVVGNDAMLQWLDWAAALAVDIDHLVPAAMLLPLDDEWRGIELAGDRLVGRDGLVAPAEESLVDALVGEAGIAWLDEQEIAASIERIAAAPEPDLRSGRFARRRRIAIDRARVRELVILAAVIPLLALLHALVLIARLHQSTATLDRDTVELARSVAGPTVTSETAESALLARGAGEAGAMSAPVSALLAQVQGQPTLTTTQIGYSGDGTLTTTLAAPTAAAINQALLALQRDGYRITAVPRQAPDGRSMADVTIRSGQ